ncbi:MAG TPA: helix-turn-helix transcriptional regulator [Archangium sp.]|jgi:transcriptional regulator with XRE-family HTH domain|uniref:helix-turn-helix domain-containing protein n=1 Tax=Archangium sp. TaxID=1872627 RepID=UPI002ED9D9C8
MDDLDKLKRGLGTGLLTARERVGLTQAEVASRSGIAHAVYGRIERGQMLPSVPTLFRLCTVLEVSANVLLGLSSAEPLPMPDPRAPGDSPELRRLANILRTLSPSALRTMSALAAAIRK